MRLLNFIKNIRGGGPYCLSGCKQYLAHLSREIKPSLNREGLEGFQSCCFLKRLLPAPSPCLARFAINGYGSAFGPLQNGRSLIRDGKSNLLKRTYHPNVLSSYRLKNKFSSRFTLHPSLKKRAAFTLAEGATHVAHSHNIRRAAFTLAEVLITLGIIGVVAAITIPALMSQYKDMVAKQQFKRAYSVIQQAFQAVYADEEYNYSCYYWDKNPYPSRVCVERNDAGICIKFELPDGSPLPSDYVGGTTECKTFTAAVEKHLNIIKKCEGNALKGGCIPKYTGNDTYSKEQDDSLSDEEALEKHSGCANWTQNKLENNCTAYVLSDGTIILLYGTSFRLFAIDINGMKGPNKWGHDLFSFGSRGNLNKPPYVATDLSCNPWEKGGRNTASMLLNAYK